MDKGDTVNTRVYFNQTSLYELSSDALRQCLEQFWKTTVKATGEKSAVIAQGRCNNRSNEDNSCLYTRKLTRVVMWGIKWERKVLVPQSVSLHTWQTAVWSGRECLIVGFRKIVGCSSHTACTLFEAHWLLYSDTLYITSENFMGAVIFECWQMNHSLIKSTKSSNSDCKWCSIFSLISKKQIVNPRSTFCFFCSGLEARVTSACG